MNKLRNSIWPQRQTIGEISHIQGAINHPVTAAMAQHVVYFWGTHLKVSNPQKSYVFFGQNHQLPFARGWTVCLHWPADLRPMAMKPCCPFS